MRDSAFIESAFQLAKNRYAELGVDGMLRIALACSEIIEVTDDKQYDRILAGNIKKKDVPTHVFGGPIDESVEQGVDN